MQKANTQLHNSADQNKIREPKTPPVPVPKPKKADKIREADKKFFERLKKLTAPLVVGVLLTYLWLSQPLFTKSALSDAHQFDTAPSMGTHQGRRANTMPAPDPRNGIAANKDQNLKQDQDKPINRPTNEGESAFASVQEIELKKKMFAIIPSFGDRIPADASLSLLLKLIKDKPLNIADSELLDTLSSLPSSLDAQVLFQTVQRDRRNLQKLTLITFELKECTESSSKDLYTLDPVHHARLQLIVRGIDAQTGSQLFEKTIEKEKRQEDWAKFRVITDSIGDDPSYLSSNLMQELLVESANEIIDLLHKYLP